MKDVLSHSYIQAFLKEIRDSFGDLQERRKNNTTHLFDSVIANLYDVLLQLDEDINYQYPEDEEVLINEEDDILDIFTYQ
jgi:hypothetical protein